MDERMLIDPIGVEDELQDAELDRTRDARACVCPCALSKHEEGEADAGPV